MLRKRVNNMFTKDQYKVLSSAELLKAQQKQQQKHQKYLDIETKVQFFCFGMAFMLFLAAVIELYCN